MSRLETTVDRRGASWFRFSMAKPALPALVVGAMLAALLPACGSSKAASPPSGSTTTKPASSAQPGQVVIGASDPANQGTAVDPAKVAYTPTGNIVATDGFDPAKDGFGFINYGSTLPSGLGLNFAAGTAAPTDLTSTSLQQTFGNSVCANTQCDLTPEAQNWLTKTNQAMGTGHCYGFSDASLQFFTGKADPNTYGAASTALLNFSGNADLQTFLAQNWAFQKLPSVTNAALTGSATAIINTLKKALVPNPTETYTLVFFNLAGNGGHAVTPYTIEDNGNGQFHILVYDNNFPGVVRAVAVDTNANTWQYTGGPNPSDLSELYQGTDQNQLQLHPLTPAEGVQPWTYGGTAASPARVMFPSKSKGTPAFLVDTRTGTLYDDIYLNAGDQQHGHLLITNPSGQHVGYLNGALVNTIPGAKIERALSDQTWALSPEPDYLVPDGVAYTITLDGTGMTKQDPVEDVGMIAPGFDFDVDNIALNPGEKDTATVSADGSSVSYTASSKQAPDLYYGVSDATSDYTFLVSGDDVPANGTLKMDLPVNGTGFTFSTVNTGSASNAVSVAVDKIDDTGSHHFESNGIDLADGDTATLKFGAWTPGQPMQLEATQNGQTNTESLPDQAPPDSNPGTSSTT